MSTPFPVTTEFRVVGAEETKQTFGEFLELYKQFPAQTKELNVAMRDQAEHIYAMRRSYMLLRTEWRVYHAQLIEGMRAMMRLGSIGRELMQIWQAHMVYQIRLSLSIRSYKEAQERAAEMQELYNQYLRDFGAESVYTLDALKRLKDAQIDVEEASRDLQRAQQDQITGWVTTGLRISTVIAYLADLYYHLKILGGLAGTTGPVGLLSGTFAGLGAGIAAALALGGAAILGFYYSMATNLAGIRDAWRENWMVTLVLAGQRFEWFVGSIIAWWPEISAAADRACDAIEEAWGNMVRELIGLWIDLNNVIVDVYNSIAGFTGLPELPRMEYTKEQYETARRTREIPTVVEHPAETYVYQPFEAGAFGGWGAISAQRGIPYVPENMIVGVERGEAILRESEATEYRMGRGVLGIRNVTINQYIGNISSEVDIRRAGETMYRMFMEKLAGE